MNRFITRITGMANEKLKEKQKQVWEAANKDGWLDMALYVYSNKMESYENRQARLDGIIAGISAGDIVVVQLPTGNGAKWEQEFITKIKAYGGRVIVFLHSLSEDDSINVLEKQSDIIYTCNYQDAVIVNSFEELNQLRSRMFNEKVKFFVREKVKNSDESGFITQDYYTRKVLNITVEAVLTDEQGIYKLVNNDEVRGEDVGRFTYAVVRESYKGNHAISFAYSGEYDFISISTSKGVIWETKDSNCHYALINIKDVAESYIIRAYVQTLSGKMLIAESESLRVSEQIFDSDVPKISIIIPVYNAQDSIARAIDNILAQSQSEIELIVVDDGSVDNTADIVSWYSEKYRNVYLLRKENGGIASARNLGIKHAKGKYIGFMDGDDMMPVYSYEWLYNSLEDNSTDIAFGNIVRLNNSSRIISMKYNFEDNKALDPNDYIKNYIMEMGNVVWNKLYKANLCKEHLFGPKAYEDMAWTPMIFSYANTISYVNKITNEWDQSKETEGQRIIKKTNQERIGYFREAIFYFLDNCNPKKRYLLKETVLKKYVIYMASMPEIQSLFDEIERKY